MTDPMPAFDSPYDEAEFLNRLEGDRELSDEITHLFLDTCPKSLAELQSALGEGNLYMLGRLAHGVKGSVGVFAAEACFAAALALELAGRQGNLGAAQEAWARLKGEMQRLTAALDERLAGAARCESL